MSHPARACTPLHRLAHSDSAAPRWISAVVAAAAVTVAAIPAIAPPLAPNDIRVVEATHVAFAAQPTALTNRGNIYVGAHPADTTAGTSGAPILVEQSPNALPSNSSRAVDQPEKADISVIIDDFRQGGIAQVLRHQLTSRTTDPNQLQILNDFFEGGVYQSEAHRFLQLFKDPQQQQFIRDFVTGGLIQVVRNRLLDATTDPQMRQAIINFFPDEVTDYRGGPLTVLQRRLLAAAKGNTTVIAVVNAIFENPIVSAVRHVIGGGPIIGTPLDELPPLPPSSVAGSASKQPEPTVVAKTAVLSSVPSAALTPASAPKPAVAPAKPSTALAEPSTAPAASGSEATVKPKAEPEDADGVKTGNKVKPTATEGTKRTPGRGSQGIFGQVADGIAKGLAGGDAASTPAAAAGNTGSAEGAGNDGGES